MARTLRQSLSQDLFEALIPVLVLLPLLWALLPGGLPNTADGTVHFVRASEMVHAWRDGVFVPRWAENLGYGYGIPLFVYAPPLPYFATAALHLLGLPMEWAFKGMMVAGVLIGGLGAYALARTRFGSLAGAVGMAAFLYAPIQLRELFIQGNVAQYLAWSFPPWAAWAIIQHFRHRRGRYPVVLGFALTGALLCHNAAALLTMGLVATLAPVLFLFSRNGRALRGIAAGSVLGLALSAWFWVPALLEGKYIQLDRIVASDFRSRFIDLTELIALSPRLDTGAINPYFPLTLGAVQVWLGVVGAVGLTVWIVDAIRRGNMTRRTDITRRTDMKFHVRTASTPTSDVHADALLAGETLFFVLFTAFCGFMATVWSEPTWEILPFVDLFEWPFRWHGFTALGLSWLCAAAVFVLGRGADRWMHGYGRVTVAGLALLLLIGSALVNLTPQKLLPGTRRSSPAEVARFEVKSAAVGTTSLGEFNPIWIDGALEPSPLVDDYLGTPEQDPAINRLPAVLPTGAKGELVASTVQRQVFEVSLPQPTTLTLNLLYFPGWTATIDGEPVDVRPHSGSGLIDVDLPAGEHTLALQFVETPLRRAMDWVSFIAWVSLSGIAGWWTVRRQRQGDSSRTPARARPGNGQRPLPFPAAAVGLTMAFLLLAQIVLVDRFRLQSAPDQALPAKAPLRADFGDRLRLLGVDPPPDVVKTGDTLTAVAYWRSLASMDEDYGVFLHLDDPVTGVTVAAATQPHPSDIPTSGWATGQYVRNPLKLTVPVDVDPIQYSLRVGVYDHADGALLDVAGNDADVVEIGRIWVEPSHSLQAPSSPQARFGDGVELLEHRYDAARQTFTLRWRTRTGIDRDYSIFVHVLDTAGETIGQADGAPYGNRYPTSAWRPGQVIEDRRDLGPVLGIGQPAGRIAVGVYDPATGVRLPATDAGGSRLPDDALVIEVPTE